MERGVAYGGLGLDGSDVQYEDATSALTRIGQRRRLACTRPPARNEAFDSVIHEPHSLID